jgi:CheY-like chemotaxis protein
MTAPIERANPGPDSGRRVVVVDDDVVLLDLMGEVLREAGWTGIAVGDASTAVTIVRNERPDAIILDVRIRESQSGWDILRDLKENPLTRATPVIVWSGDARLFEDKGDWLEQHGIRTLSKPFEIDHLYRLLGEAFDGGNRPVSLEAALA